MRLIEFLSKINALEKKQELEGSFFSTHTVLHFLSGDSKVEYPLLFFSSLMKKLKTVLPFDIETVHIDSQKISLVKSKLATTFLGQKKLYWLEGLALLKGKDKKNWESYLQSYEGPNIVAFFSDSSFSVVEQEDAQKVIVQVEYFVDQKTFMQLVALCAKSITRSSSKVLTDIFVKHNRLTLDVACMLMNYVFLAGKKYKEFSESWLNKIITPEKSLFVLSQYFFGKNSKLFFQLWQELQDDYSEQFWIIFWSEQIWRACNVIQLMEQKKIAEARKVNFRLPFSFMQRSWRNFTAYELANAHNFLYSIDYSFKNGGDPFSLDLFYSKFLTGQFCVERA